jgi:two-component system response regulator
MKPQIILLVEDNLKDEMLTLRSLKKCHVANEVVVVRDGAEALDYLFATGEHAARDPADLPTVVLLDLNLPKIDGLEVLRRIRVDERCQLLPIVILTSSDEERDILAGYELGANSYVRKPVAFADFSRAVADLGRYWLLTNEPPPKGRG